VAKQGQNFPPSGVRKGPECFIAAHS
jgi:hypothetical protein